MFGRKPADGAGGGSSANAQSTPPAKKGFAAGLFGTSATPRSAHGEKPAPRTPQAELRDDDLPGMFTRATTLLENIQRRVSASSGAQGANGTADDADNARQFMRVNEVKRLTTRIRTGVATLADAGEKGAWEAQLVLLESETATAVEAVLSAASPAPAETRRPERRDEQTTPEAGSMFAGLNVSPAAPPPTTTTLSPKSAEVPTSTKPAVTGSPSTSAADPAPAPTAGFALGGGDGGLFRGLDVSPSPRPASSGAPPPPPASPGIVLEPPPPPLDASAFSTRATTEPSSPRTETVFGNVSKTPPDAPPAPGSAAAAVQRDESGPATSSPGPKRRPRVRVGYARQEEPDQKAVEPPIGGSSTAPSRVRANDGAEAGARSAREDAAKTLPKAETSFAERTRNERETQQAEDAVRKWKAAVVIQSRYRGRRGRAAVSATLAAMAVAAAAAEEEDRQRAAAASRAATRIQAAHRARAARAEVQKMRSAAKAAAAAAVAAAAEIRAAEAAEAAAAAQEEAAEVEAAAHRAREAAAARIQTALRGRAARLETSRRRVAAAAARDAAAKAEREEQRARKFAATRIQAAARARAARVAFEKRRNLARLSDSRRDESDRDADAARGVARCAAADLAMRQRERGDDDACAMDEVATSSEDVATWASPVVEVEKDVAATEDGSVLDAAATLDVAAAAAAATEVLEHARRRLKGADEIGALANALDRVAAAAARAAREARRCVGAAEPEPEPEPELAAEPGGAAAPPSFDLISF